MGEISSVVLKNLVSLQPTVLEAPVYEDVRALLHITLLASLLGCWWVREWEQSEDLGPEQYSGVGVWPPYPGREPLPLPVCSWVHYTPSWLEPIQWIVLPSSPCIPGESEPLDECSCCRAGAWAKSREKRENFHPFILCWVPEGRFWGPCLPCGHCCGESLGLPRDRHPFQNAFICLCPRQDAGRMSFLMSAERLKYVAPFTRQQE